MPPIHELQKARAEAVAKAKAIVDKAKSENRETTADENVQVDAFLEQVDGHDKQIKQQQEAAGRAARLNAAAVSAAAPLSRELEEDEQPKPRVQVIGPRMDDKKRHGFASIGHYAMAVRNASIPGAVVDPRLQIVAAASGMSQGVPADGGFAVPPSFSTTIWDGLNTDNGTNLLPLMDNYTVEGESLTLLANAETSRASSVYGGAIGYWISEAGQITSSKPKLRDVKLEPQQVAALVYVTDKLLRNSPVALDQYLTRASIAAINFKVGDALINGDGVGKPKGVLASGSLVSVAKETSQVAATFVKANANKMWARLHPNARTNAVWLYNVDVEPQFDDFNTLVKNVAGSENVGGFGSQIYNAERQTLKGRPLIPSEFAATAGTAGDVILMDPKGYVVGTRGGVESAMSMHLRFDYAESAFRFIFEIDGQPWLASALTPFKGSNTLSTHVVTAVRS